jgi:uncharacterized membrane protein required for colicin V production
MDNWLVIILIVIVLIGITIGSLRGFLKMGVTLISTVLTVALMIFLTPIIGGLVQEHTPLGRQVEERALEAFMPELTYEDMRDFDDILEGTALEGLSEEQWEQVSELEMQRAGITEELILEQMGELPRDAQTAILEQAPIPEFIRNELIENNNPVIYNLLGVSTFPEYIASMLARMTIYTVAFLISFFVSILVVLALLGAVEIIGELPVAGIINRIGGAIVGGGLAIVVIWLLFLVLSVIYTFTVGLAIYEHIASSELLTMLYENNMIRNRLLGFETY